jgi:hypothetical protein
MNGAPGFNRRKRLRLPLTLVLRCARNAVVGWSRTCRSYL